MPQTFRLLFRLFAACAVWTALVPPTLAAESYQEFYDALKSRGYGMIAIDYLESLKANNKLPKAIADTYDLELSKCYRLAIKEAFNQRETDMFTAKAKEHLDKFLKEHPESGAVADALQTTASTAFDQALQQLRAARSTKDVEQRDKLMADARQGLLAARPGFEKSAEAFTQQHAETKKKFEESLPPKNAKGVRPALTPKLQKMRDSLEEDMLSWLESRFKLAMVDYYTAQTYPDLGDKAVAEEHKAADKDKQAAMTAGDKTRKESLLKAAKAFDSIFQENRESLVGLHAHVWHGKCADEMGEFITAQDIYEEVLSIAPDDFKEKETGLEPLLAQVEYFRLLVVLRQKGSEEFVAQAADFVTLDKNKLWKDTSGLLGIKLQLAKLMLDPSNRVNANDKSGLTSKATKMLTEVSKVRSEHQEDAILLLKTLRKARAGGDGADQPTAVEATTFEEAMAEGNSAFEDGEFARAEEAFRKAVEEFAAKVKDKQLVADAQVRLDQARFRGAYALYTSGKYDEARKKAGVIVKNKQSTIAPMAAALAVQAALSSYIGAKEPEEKEATLATLVKVANYTVENWPEAPEADDARISLGKAKLVQGDVPAALAVFEGVNPRSERYPLAMYLAGQFHWRLYLGAKPKDASAPKDPALVAELAKCAEQLQVSLDGQKKLAEPGQPVSKEQLDTQLLLGEVLVESEKYEAALALLQPFIDEMKAKKPERVENPELRTLVGGFKANLYSGQLAKSGEVAAVLIQVGPDAPLVNGVLASLVKMYHDQYKSANAALIEAGEGNLTAAEEPTQRMEAIKEQLKALIAGLSERKEFTLQQLLYIADTATQVKEAELAGTIYQGVLKRADDGEAIDKNAVMRIRSQIVDLQRQKGEYEEALTQVDKLLKDSPNALEPLMVKGHILQSWSKRDPKQFPLAVTHWTELRTKLSAMKKKPPQYYEVILNTAECLLTDFDKSRDKQKALDAEKILNATLVLSPNLDGADTVARFKQMIKRAQKAQGKAPGKAPAPTAAAAKK